MVKMFWMIVGATLVPLGYEFLRTKKYLRPRGLDLRQLYWRKSRERERARAQGTWRLARAKGGVSLGQLASFLSDLKDRRK
jgi:hypothetical protein